jgi:hypothetical protein
MAGVTLPAVSPGMRQRNEYERRALLPASAAGPVLLPLDGSAPIETISKTVRKYITDYIDSNPQVCASWPGFREWWSSSLMAHTDEGPVMWGVAEGGLAG